MAEVDLDNRRDMALRFRNNVLARVKAAAPGTRVTLTLWNTDGRITTESMQRLTVASKHCKERVFEIPGADLDIGYPNMTHDDPEKYRLHGNAKARERLDTLAAKIMLALISRE